MEQQKANGNAARSAQAPPTHSPLITHHSWPTGAVLCIRSRPSLPLKCLARECIEGLPAAIEEAKSTPMADELKPPFDEKTIVDLLRGGVSAESGRSASRIVRPTVLRGATLGWGPTYGRDTRYMQSVAGEEELEVTVVEQEGSFEVRHDRIECRCTAHAPRRLCAASLSEGRRQPDDLLEAGATVANGRPAA